MKAFFAKAYPLFKLPTCQSLSTILLDQEFKNIRTVINYLLNETLDGLILIKILLSII